MAIEGEIVLWAAVIGLLIGIIWSLRHLMLVEKRQMELNHKLEQLLTKKVAKASESKKK